MAFLKQLGGFDASGLGTAQRVLLVTDGTLTDTLEALFAEPIELRKLDLHAAAATGDPSPLEAVIGAEVLYRTILLYGGNSGRNYVYAKSELAVERLPPSFRDGLKDSDTPMGRLWTQHRMETRKELLSAGLIDSGDLAAHFPGCPDGLVTRTYRVISGGLPLMVITECFPRHYGAGS